ncbi:2',5' RNA ligase family [Caloramator mitchellensis]|uniref:RNA 2',3'-cyclic phosphodiesterase n=1 Tax=Caloramator mitchellensis TaxID=908809 RepID=A0A0R3K3W6_CALMK|nr:RNA 2',3'-cyclic phosphodiesterase [Caloramator mitchellensis]KRQ88116.1 2',5' RNA ligase family [Caloramator mitchellensis]
MRTFITFEFDTKSKERIAEIQRIIKQNSNKGRFKYIDNFHLTIKFLGETNHGTIDKIYKKLLESSVNFSKIHIQLNGIDAFGVGKNIRTIYLKIIGEIEKITNIAEAVDVITLEFGFKRENKFTPHVTIAQDVDLKVSFDELKNKLKEIKISDIIFDKLVIMKSEEIDGKRVYTPLKIIHLK